MVNWLPARWSFGGKVSGGVSDIAATSGSDDAGAFKALTFTFEDGGAKRGAIRIYEDHPSIMFVFQSVSPSSTNIHFPLLTTLPGELSHLTHDGVFALWSFWALPKTGPWQFFDSANRSFILSAANQFGVVEFEMLPGGAIRSGVLGRVESLPAGFELRTSLTLGAGINKTFELWGRFLTSLYGKNRVASDADVVSGKLGYWTDAGATYYYGFDQQLGYAGTLEAIRREFDQMEMQLGYLQLDSWFYPKGERADWRNVEGGIYEYRADTQLFGPNLRTFRDRLGVPLVTHARWIDRNSPYRRQFRMSGNVILDPLYWAEVARYLADSGVLTFEQDWLGTNAQTDTNLEDSPAFFRVMSEAMKQYGITIQYCMATPRHFLETVRHSNVTNIRVSEDRFSPGHWTDFLYGSRLAYALGVWPFSDVLMSAETNNLLLATLSAGPVGVGDKFGTFDVANLYRAARKDGVLVKPDRPAFPIDRILQSDARYQKEPMIAATHTDHEAGRTAYVIAYPRGEKRDAQLTLTELGIDGPAFVYNYFQRSGGPAAAGGTIGGRIEGDLDYLIVAPMVNGIALLGDLDHFASLGKKRIASVKASRGLTIEVLFAAGERTRTLYGFTAGAPTVLAAAGTATLDFYDEGSGIFGITVGPGPAGANTFEVATAAP